MDSKATIPVSCASKLKVLKNKLVLVTGGCGFVGRHIVELLLEVGARVRVFDIFIRDYLPELVKAQQLEFFKGDLNSSTDVDNALEDVFGVIHVASPNPLSKNEALFMKVNVDGTRSLLEACVRKNVEKFVHTSSASIMFEGKDQAYVDETFPFPKVPADPYTKSKLYAEFEVLKANSNKLFTCAIRPHSIWGPGDPHFLPALVEAARANKTKWIVGDGTNIADFTYVTNVAYSHLLALASLKKGAKINGQAYFITNKTPVVMWDFMSRLLSTFGYDQPYISLPASLMKGVGILCDGIAAVVPKFKPTFSLFKVRYLTVDHYYDCTKAERDFGYQPAVPISVALQRTYDAFPTLHNNKHKSSTGSQPPTKLPLVLFIVMMSIIAFNWDYTTTQILGLVVFVVYLFFINIRQKFTKKPNLSDKMALITGGNRGIGREIVRRLVNMNCKVILCCRNEASGQEAVRDIEQTTGKAGLVTVLPLDLSSLKSVRDVIHATKQLLSKQQDQTIDYLFNNAGAAMLPSKITNDGFNLLMQTNYVGHYVLTNELLDGKLLSEKARIVNVASAVHEQGALDVNLHCLTSTKLPYSTFSAIRGTWWKSLLPMFVGSDHVWYATSKLANIMFSHELQFRRLAGTSITSISVHPGIIFSGFYENYLPQILVKLLTPFFMIFSITEAQGADTPLIAALSPELEGKGGIYLDNGRVTRPANHAHDWALSKQLWERTEELVYN